MRYWIYWNDLVQGPFEPGELAGLKAFTADLMVCEEEGQEWAPAAAVSDLLPYFQPVTVPINQPSSSPPPPPPPPSRPAGSPPLQGEFFNETSGQESLFDLNGSKLYYFRPAEDSVAAPEPTLEPFTTPFRFISVVHVVSDPPVQESPAFLPTPELPRAPIPLREPDPVFIEESELGILEPEEIIESQPEAPPAPRYVPPPLVPPTQEPPAAAAPPPVLPLPPLKPPEPAKPAVPPPDKKTTQGHLTPVEPRVIQPAAEPRSEVARQLRRERLIPVTPPPRAAAPVPEPVEIRPFELPTARPERTRLWPWIAGLLVVVGTGAGMFYLKMNRAIEPPAIVEAELPPVVEAPVVIPEPEPPPPPPAVIKPVKKAEVKPPPKPKAEPKPEPVAAPVPETRIEAVLPGLGELEAEPAPAPAPAPAVEPEPAKPVTVNPWKGKDSEAIALVLKQKIYEGKRTIGENAKMILDQTHEKELVHAADTGQRLYLPDKLSWSSLNEEGPKYRVYLTFIAWQANGERIQARADAFLVDLEKKTVAPADENTQQDFYDLTKMPQHQPNQKAADVESILGAVDALNRQKVSAVVLKSSKRGKEEKKAQLAAMESAETKLQKTVVYFRTKYAEKTLQNVGKAYGFESTLKGK